MTPIRFGSNELLHRICGGLEVAGDIADRSSQLYRATTGTPHRHAVDLMDQAARLLSEAVEVLSAELRVKAGPAARGIDAEARLRLGSTEDRVVRTTRR